MHIRNIGNIQNKSGIINFGDIQGDAIAGVHQAFNEKANDSEEQIHELKSKILDLVDLLNDNAEQIEQPDSTLKRITKLSEEISSDDADKTIIDRYLELINKSVSKVPSLLNSIVSIKEIVGKIFV